MLRKSSRTQRISPNRLSGASSSPVVSSSTARANHASPNDISAGSAVVDTLSDSSSSTPSRTTLRRVDSRSQYSEDGGAGVRGDQTDSHGGSFHYAPTVAALLPIFCSLVFGSPSETWTDLMLLVLVAIYCHNCVTVPWDYYRRSQIRFRELKPDKMTPEQRGAYDSLRRATFNAFLGLVLGPVLGALLLNYVRSVMARPANGLISNFNIGIFVLSAEIRPIRLTYYYLVHRSDEFQKQLVDAPESRYEAMSSVVLSLQEEVGRLKMELERQAISAAGQEARQRRPSASVKQGATAALPDKEQIAAAASAAAQGEVDALKRALRRYERHDQQLKDQWERRLQDIETTLIRQRDLVDSPINTRRVSFEGIPRTSAASTSGSTKRGAIGTVVHALISVVKLPARLVWTVISLPARVVHGISSM
ncbi:hypothetical protein PYCC9005_000064 [Savitreella phatthalungensis]